VVPSSHELAGCLVVEAVPGPVVELGGDQGELFRGPDLQVGSLGEILAEKAVGVLVAAALPG
jgi:hypothetical protein